MWIGAIGTSVERVGAAPGGQCVAWLRAAPVAILLQSISLHFVFGAKILSTEFDEIN
jgi:hypothetical protein